MKKKGRTIMLGVMLLAGASDLAGQEIQVPLLETYAGEIAGTPATLTLERSGDAIVGAIDAAGYGYVMQGRAEGSAATGTLADPQTGASMPFEMVEQSGTVTVAIVSQDPFTGQSQRVEFVFRGASDTGRVGAGGSGVAGGPVADVKAGLSAGNAPAAESGVQRDPALVGSWMYSDTYISGEFSATTRLYLQIHPNGTYVHGSGNVSAGLDNDLGSIHGNSGSGDVTRGEWRTEGGIVYVREPGYPQWSPYARYYVEGGSMMFTFGDGKRQVWNRQ